jgi:hypothetical protein
MVTFNIPVGCLADDASLAAKRAEIKEKLLSGPRIYIAPSTAKAPSLSIGDGGKVETI